MVSCHSTACTYKFTSYSFYGNSDIHHILIWVVEYSFKHLTKCTCIWTADVSIISEVIMYVLDFVYTAWVWEYWLQSKAMLLYKFESIGKKLYIYNYTFSNAVFHLKAGELHYQLRELCLIFLDFSWSQFHLFHLFLRIILAKTYGGFLSEARQL